MGFRIRARVEHVFGDQKNGMGAELVRTIGTILGRPTARRADAHTARNALQESAARLAGAAAAPRICACLTPRRSSPMLDM